MAHRPLVSILTPAYKAEPYIGQAIESVLAQTMPDWELIIVEDCSPDKTAQVVEQYLGDPRIKLIRNEQNLGECGSRNRALDAAQGEWITLLDADDWYEPQRLERMLELAQNTQEKVVIDLRRSVQEGTGETRIANISTVYPNPSVPKRFSLYECIYGHIVEKPLIWHETIRRHQLRYREGVLKGGDYIFNIQVIHWAGGLWVLPEVLYNYRVHPNSMIRQLRTDLSKTHFLYETIMNLPEIQSDARLRRAVMADYRRELGYQKLNDFRRALRRLSIGDMVRTYREAPAVLTLFLKELPDALRRRLRPNVR